jgi:hypothetical protein
MSFLLYKDYVIVAGAVPDEVKVKYNPIASISWDTTTGARSTHCSQSRSNDTWHLTKHAPRRYERRKSGSTNV